MSNRSTDVHYTRFCGYVKHFQESIRSSDSQVLAKLKNVTNTQSKSVACTESEPQAAKRNRVPFLASGIGTRIAAVAGLLGVRKNAYEAAGVSSATLQRYIAGDSAPTFESMARLCLEGGARLEWLATGDGPMLVSETASDGHSQAARPDLGKLADALALIDQALTLTRRSATVQARATLVAMAYDVLCEEESVASALRRIMTAVETTTEGILHGQEG